MPGRLSKDIDVRHTIFTAGVIIYLTDHGIKWVSRFYLFLGKLDSEPVSTRNLVVGLCSVFLLSSYLMYSFRYAHNAYNATNLFGKYERSDFSTSRWQSARRSDQKSRSQIFKPRFPVKWRTFELIWAFQLKFVLTLNVLFITKQLLDVFFLPSRVVRFFDGFYKATTFEIIIKQSSAVIWARIFIQFVWDLISLGVVRNWTS